MTAVDFLHHENPSTWAGVEAASLATPKSTRKVAYMIVRDRAAVPRTPSEEPGQIRDSMDSSRNLRRDPLMSRSMTKADFFLEVSAGPINRDVRRNESQT
ncbi:hypothetical protein TNCV_1316061 [Trichonephila clavipes]|nr:hypothetical protein TNCV_1316061 [Trichonephila clavipes]